MHTKITPPHYHPLQHHQKPVSSKLLEADCFSLAIFATSASTASSGLAPGIVSMGVSSVASFSFSVA
jgi:hypothetical protein